MKARRLGLRARVITAIAIGALLLSVLLSVVTYSLTRANLIEARQDEAFTNAATNALTINEQMSESTDIVELVPLMEDVITPTDTLQAMLLATRVYPVDVFRFTEVQLNSIPGVREETFLTELAATGPAQITYDIDGAPHYIVGLPLPAAQSNAYYIQAAPLADVEQSFRSLLPTLLGASAITTILGLLFGIYVAKRVLSPINEISDAAGLIAAGDLSHRLDGEADPDLDQLVQSFNGMTGALQERIERDSRFASDVSHELRSPLMTLTGSVAVLERRREEMPERAQLALDLLSTDIRRFKLLVEDLLEISRFDVGAIELDSEEVIFGEFVRQALRATGERDREVTIIHDERSEDAFIVIDKRRVAQVIRNLSENADKYAGGVTQVRLHCDGDDIRIEVEDEGPGVPIEERELIFERFARGSEGGRRGSGTGVGLGLSLVTEHLRLHGGTIGVADRVDGLLGSRFVVSLPGVIVE